MDIRFYDFDFNLLYILPPFSKTIGYSSFNAKKEFNGPGSFEIVFLDDELKKLIEKNRDGLFVQCGKFQGYVTGYQWKGNSYSTFGKHLNGLLSWRVIPPVGEWVPKDEDSEELEFAPIKQSLIKVFEKLTEPYEDMLVLGKNDSLTELVEYINEKHEKGDKVIESLSKNYGTGYEITADFGNKKLLITFKGTVEKNLMLSENNLNAYDITVSYDNKEQITGGYYKETYIEWDDEEKKDVEKTRYPYIGNKTVTGLKKKDFFFSSETECGAELELANKKVFNQYTFETKNIEYGVDYQLGDIVRVQTGTETIKRKITAVNFWNEKEYGEKPILSEVEE